MKQLGELKSELGQLRIQKVVSAGSKLNKMYVFSFSLRSTWLSPATCAPD